MTRYDTIRYDTTVDLFVRVKTDAASGGKTILGPLNDPLTTYFSLVPSKCADTPLGITLFPLVCRKGKGGKGKGRKGKGEDR